MLIEKHEEAGYEQALKGIALSFYDHAIPFSEFWTEERRNRTIHRSKELAFKGGGHNKFLASIFTWWFIQAPRGFWQEYDTYKVATTAQSASTMHTLDKRQTNWRDYEVGTSELSISAFNKALESYKEVGNQYHKDISCLKQNLPEGWLQERIVCINYMTIQNILSQREGHRFKLWGFFKEQVLEQLDFPELVWKVATSKSIEWFDEYRKKLTEEEKDLLLDLAETFEGTAEKHKLIIKLAKRNGIRV